MFALQLFFRNANAENTEENDETEEIDVTGIDLPSKPNCSQIDFDMLAMSQSILDYVKQQEAINSGKKVPENPTNSPETSSDLPETMPEMPESPPETPKKLNNEEMIFTSFPSRL